MSAICILVSVSHGNTSCEIASYLFWVTILRNEFDKFYLNSLTLNKQIYSIRLPVYRV